MESRASAATYETWRETARLTDARSGADRWKAADASPGFDYRVLRDRLTELRQLRSSGDSRKLIYYFDEGLHGNMAGMGAPSLYRKSALGTKHVIEDYVAELVAGLDQVAEDETLDRAERVDFFRRARHAYGSCALMLSGAGSLGPFHFGVVRALAQQNLLPNIISGASAGSLVASFACTRRPEELAEALENKAILDQIEMLGAVDATGEGSSARISTEGLRALVETWIPDVTFADVLEISGRHLNVSVAPSELHQQSRTLNALTAPNVLVREAVLASCAVPGVFPPVSLLARGPDGRKRPYVQSRTWVDGSVTDDMPVGRLARLYGANFFIASQTNPIVLWALLDPHATDPFSQFAAMSRVMFKEWLRRSYPLAMNMVRNHYPLNVWTRLWYGVWSQDYTADVNIVPGRRLYDPRKLLSPLEPKEALRLIADGERSTWPKVERIRICTAVGRSLDAHLAELEDQSPLVRSSSGAATV
ncbi:MAG: DUF3336 domain-containing protein [Pseudomonadota bacterium]